MKPNNWIRYAVAGLLSIMLFSAAIPAFAATTYTAKDSDTLWKISQTFGVSVDSLMTANPSVRAENIYEGLKINIPSVDKDVTTNTTVAPSTLVNTASTKNASAFVLPVSVGNGSVTSAGGVNYSIKKSFQVKASAYSASAEENGGWGSVDFFGNPLRIGTIAVDPSVIPYGTKLYVTGYNCDILPVGGMIVTAADSGGAIKGKRIDIFMPGSGSQISNFGFQYLTVHILI